MYCDFFVYLEKCERLFFYKKFKYWIRSFKKLYKKFNSFGHDYCKFYGSNYKDEFIRFHYIM